MYESCEVIRKKEGATIKPMAHVIHTCSYVVKGVCLILGSFNTGFRELSRSSIMKENLFEMVTIKGFLLTLCTTHWKKQ